MLHQSITANNQTRTHLYAIVARENAAQTQASGTEARLYLFILALRLLPFTAPHPPHRVIRRVHCIMRAFSSRAVLGATADQPRVLRRAGEETSMDFSLLVLVEPNYT